MKDGIIGKVVSDKVDDAMHVLWEFIADAMPEEAVRAENFLAMSLDYEGGQKAVVFLVKAGGESPIAALKRLGYPFLILRDEPVPTDEETTT